MRALRKLGANGCAWLKRELNCSKRSTPAPSIAGAPSGAGKTAMPWNDCPVSALRNGAGTETRPLRSTLLTTWPVNRAKPHSPQVHLRPVALTGLGRGALPPYALLWDDMGYHGFEWVVKRNRKYWQVNWQRISPSTLYGFPGSQPNIWGCQINEMRVLSRYSIIMFYLCSRL